ncbi:hypothetical protein SPRG_18845 [Saprolegnia parasitica CBS 223.65]|uniref:VHS domain-containing protein n=1 Tax=Saprolegnia parasitica (strain CBS 223.65) TaxID=695850 RepID=A0A067D9N1_SAPPC|nr:hypothetical protein SPRG_18845 [Saprolegnia parasitica CBS 223.65]KDO35687.1 hypothetical protein SPRG_18845 [Saprolegnia parasitica CBS 223.65]|eukprot:XP_012194061.1 hypothetical protein SPRG_18845 [Saprolegnia parasitica CBS 223.65]
MDDRASDDVCALLTTVCAGDATNPDWGVILELCDVVGASPADGEATSRAIQRLLSRRESEDHVSLALLTTETIMKNCPSFVNLVAHRLFLQEIVALVDGDGRYPDASARALRMLQEWSTEYPSQPVFRDTFMQLQLQSASAGSVDVDDRTPVAKPSLALEFDKLRQDLVVVEDKIKTYVNLVALGNCEDAEDVLDFLQQCQPRMNTLIEAGLAGKLDEATLETCLTVNDRLIKVLEGNVSADDDSEPKAPAPYSLNDTSPDYVSGPFSTIALSEPPPAPHRYHPDMV